MSLIKKSFQKCKIENRPALLTYTVAGDNSKIKSLEIRFEILLLVIRGFCMIQFLSLISILSD